jgi:hypothetical protein
MFYIIIFGLLAVLLVVAGLTAISRRRTQMRIEESHEAATDSARRQRKAKRTQSRNARRKRH